MEIVIQRRNNYQVDRPEGHPQKDRSEKPRRKVKKEAMADTIKASLERRRFRTMSETTSRYSARAVSVLPCGLTVDKHTSSLEQWSPEQWSPEELGLKQVLRELLLWMLRSLYRRPIRRRNGSKDLFVLQIENLRPVRQLAIAAIQITVSSTAVLSTSARSNPLVARIAVLAEL